MFLYLFYLVVCVFICCFCPAAIPYSLINFLSVYTQVSSHVFSCSMSNNPTCIPLFQELRKVKEKALRCSYHLDNYRFYTLTRFVPQGLQVKFDPALGSLTPSLRKHWMTCETTITFLRRLINFSLPQIAEQPDSTFCLRFTKPGRPIISGNGSPTEHISLFVDSFLKPLVPQISSYIHDTPDFLCRILGIQHQVPSTAIIGTLDVSSLYTNNTHDEGIDACAKDLAESGHTSHPLQTLWPSWIPRTISLSWINIIYRYMVLWWAHVWRHLWLVSSWAN